MNGALGQTRTGTHRSARILSPLCLPFHHEGMLYLLFDLKTKYNFINKLLFNLSKDTLRIFVMMGNIIPQQKLFSIYSECHNLL